MFSKALFKQSVKANWIKWLTVTVATSVMLAIVIIVLGNLAINDIRDALKDVFIQADQESEIKENSIDSYNLYLTSLDTYSMFNFLGFVTTSYDNAVAEFESENGTKPNEQQKQEIMNQVATQFSSLFPAQNGVTSEDVKQVLITILTQYENGESLDVIKLSMENWYYNTVYQNAYKLQIEDGKDENTAALNATFAKMVATDAISKYKQDASAEGYVYKRDDYLLIARSYINTKMYDNTYNLLKNVQGVAEEEARQYAVATKVLANTSISTYELWINEYKNAGDGNVTEEQKAEARRLASESISDQLPEKVAEALTELGNMDMYGLIIGSIFYRIAGLLLPMVFVIMTANGLLAGQVDSGSMAYVLSTPTKRRTITVTQMVYLIFALFTMFATLTATSVLSVFIAGGNNFAINYAEILLFNLGAFLTMFAFAGFCFMCSAIFNRTKYSLSIGGGLTIFSLVCTILGLFGSQVVPSAMRINAMDYFNYLSLITLFDTVSILDGGLSYLWKFGILFGVGVITFIIGIFRFDKKDLPL